MIFYAEKMVMTIEICRYSEIMENRYDERGISRHQQDSV